MQYKNRFKINGFHKIGCNLFFVCSREDFLCVGKNMGTFRSTCEFLVTNVLSIRDPATSVA